MAVTLAEGGPVLPPGTCIACKGANFEQKWFDLGWSMDFYGRAYICEACLREAAELIDSEKIQTLEAKIEQLQEEAINESVIRNEFRAIIDRIEFLSSVLDPGVVEEEPGTNGEVNPQPAQGRSEDLLGSSD